MTAKEITPLIMEIAEKWHVRYSITPKGPDTVNTVFELSIITGIALTEEEQAYFESKGLKLYDTEDVNDLFKYYFSQQLEIH